jgi:Uma2 family endonuclease
MATTYYTVTLQPGKLLTADEYAEIKDEPGWHSELTEGRVVHMPTVKDLRHGWVLDNLMRRISPYVYEHKLGRITYQREGYDISMQGEEGETVWAPDMAFLRAERVPAALQAMAQKHYVPLAPDLVVEVISPSQTRNEARERAQRWLAAGTRLVWNIWIDQQKVDAWTPDEPVQSLRTGKALDGLEVVPGFTMPIAELFVFA